MSDGLVAAARIERDRRAGTYPEKIHRGADPEALSIDYQCWVAIAEWLETERFFSFSGGSEPERADAPVISWPQLDAAAEKALTSVTAKLDAQEVNAEAEPEALGALRHRRSCLFAIHRAVRLRRESIETLNRELRAPKQEMAA